VILGFALMGIALAATLLCALLPRFWVADLLVHFRLQYALFALAACLILALTHHPGWAALALLIAAFQAILSAPHVNARVPALSGSAVPTTSFRAAAVNVWYRNREFDRVADFVTHEQPDLILLAEVTDKWEAALAGLAEHYPHRFSTRGTPRFTGLLLLSRWPLQAAVLPNFSDAEPAITATVSLGERRIGVLAVHPSWPVSGPCTRLRDEQLAMIGDYARRHDGPLLVLGDLNISPFSPVLQKLFAGNRLRSAAQGFGWQPTWPVFLPPAGIQIDHALVSPEIRVVDFRRGKPVGSDHLPIIIECVL
jgi:endonuclease/exonuclease/phosphatase (EEP) superfamily protein YafD